MKRFRRKVQEKKRKASARNNETVTQKKERLAKKQQATETARKNETITQNKQRLAKKQKATEKARKNETITQNKLQPFFFIKRCQMSNTVINTSTDSKNRRTEASHIFQISTNRRHRQCTIERSNVYQELIACWP